MVEWLTALLVPFLAVSVWENGEITVRAEVTTESATVADEIEVRVSVEAPVLPQKAILETGSRAAWRTQPPTAFFLNVPGLTMSRMETEQEPGEQRVTDRWTYVLTPSAPGEYVIPPLELRSEPALGGEPILTRTDPIPVTVAPVLPDDPAEAEPRPIAGPLDPPRRVPLGWIAVAVLLWGGLRWMLWKRKLARRQLAATVPRPRTLEAPASQPAAVLAELRTHVQRETGLEPEEAADRDPDLAAMFKQLEPIVFSRAPQAENERIPPLLYDRISNYVRLLRKT